MKFNALLFAKFFFMLVVFSCKDKNREKQNLQPVNLAKPKPPANDFSNFRIFQNKDSSYGYDILEENKLYIHQPFIPAVQGRQEIKSKTDAKSLAELVILKIKRHQSLIITLKELDSLKIFYK